MDSLLDYLKIQYERLKSMVYPLNQKAYDIVKDNSFDQLINDDNLCLQFIISELDFNFDIPKLNKNRASHIIVTWLLGVGLGQFFSINENCYDRMNEVQTFYIQNYNRLWLLTSFIHDFGYFCDITKDASKTLNQIQGDYKLLTDDYKNLLDGELKWIDGFSTNTSYNSFYTFNYAEIENYFNLRKEQLARETTFEKLDHGIVGGCIAFRKFCVKIGKELNFIRPSITEVQIYKIACYIAASHNIFKSPKEESDKNYINYALNDLLSNSPTRITKSNPLLLLLSLVDTVECTKRFSAKSDHKNYLQEKTILERVKIFAYDNQIIINFSELREHIMKENDDNKRNSKIGKLKSQILSIAGINTWTSFLTFDNNDDEVTISI